MPEIDWKREWSSRAVLLPLDDVDTDQIIPARFLKATARGGLGAGLFAEWRFAPDGSPRAEFPLNRPDAAGARILVAGGNFGCGSSREHAPWALREWGFAAIVARSFADIFRANALKNHLLPIPVAGPAWTRLVEALGADPALELEVDLPRRLVRAPGWEAGFEIDPFAYHCLEEGLDELGFLLSHEAAIHEYEAARAAGPGD